MSFNSALAGAFRDAWERMKRHDAAINDVLRRLSRAGASGHGASAWAVAVAVIWSNSLNGGRLFGFFNPRDLADMYLDEAGARGTADDT